MINIHSPPYGERVYSHKISDTVPFVWMVHAYGAKPTIIEIKKKLDFHMQKCPQLISHMWTKVIAFIVIALTINRNIQCNMNFTYAKIVKGVHFGFKCYACAHKICIAAAMAFFAAMCRWAAIF